LGRNVCAQKRGTEKPARAFRYQSRIRVILSAGNVAHFPG
jgi:hypothetical protein